MIPSISQPIAYWPVKQQIPQIVRPQLPIQINQRLYELPRSQYFPIQQSFQNQQYQPLQQSVIQQNWQPIVQLPSQSFRLSPQVYLRKISYFLQ